MSNQPDEQQSRQPDEQTEKPDDQQQEEEQEEQDYFLKRSTMLPIEGIVYCLEHTLVHDDTVNPYGMGEESWCKKEDHRTVYYRGHKGDVDERLDEEARSRSKPQHGDDRPGTRRMIAAPDQSGLSAAERQLVLRMTRTLNDNLTEVDATLMRILGKDSTERTEINPLLSLTDSIIDKLSDEASEPDG